MKPLIEFKLKPTASIYGDTLKVYTLYDLKIAKEVDGYTQTFFDKQVRYQLDIRYLGMTCWILDDYGHKAIIFSIDYIGETEFDIQEVEEIQTILNLFKSDMYRFVNENKSMKEWLEGEDIHVTM